MKGEYEESTSGRASALKPGSPRTDFYLNLTAIDSFWQLTDAARFTPLPADWVVIVADIESSTQAVESGRYKDVNMIGGAAICAVLNAIGERDMPFVFGGDGATLAVPGDCAKAACDALNRTRGLALETLNLSLRVGCVGVSTIRARGADVQVARYEVSPGNNLALFNGGGVELADELIKADEQCEEFRLAEREPDGPPDLTGLSCRWEPLEAEHGSILCLLVRPRASDPTARRAILRQVSEGIAAVVGTNLAAANPVKPATLRFRWPPKGLWLETVLTRGRKRSIMRFAEVLGSTIVQAMLERFGAKLGHYEAKTYREELRVNSDFCRFDDTLRMALDCDDNQIERLTEFLTDSFESGDIDFGTFKTERALMTCMLLSLEQSRHLHFIDGDDGGFWACATDMKRRARSRR